MAVLSALLFAGCRTSHAPGRPAPPLSTVPLFEAADRASALLGPSWFDLRFPPVPRGVLGCQIDSGRHEHSVYWSARVGYADEKRWGGHHARIETELVRPDSVPLSDARIDSALSAMRPTLDEVVGESAVLIERTTPTRSWVRLEQGVLHVRLEGANVVRELLRPKSDTLLLMWCRRDRPIAYARVPLVRTEDAAPPP